MAKKKQETQNASFFNLRENEAKNPHYFMCEELLVPRVNNCDTQRINMFSNHINQFVHLKTPEVPKVFTRFENQIGDYSIAKKVAKADFTIIDKIVKNKYNYVLIIQYNDTKEYDVIEYHHAKNISEDYGYALNDRLGENAKAGNQVKKGDMIYASDNYDEDDNFMYGVNLKSVYTSYHGLTYEDGVVISESAAKKLISYKVEESMLSINNNDILLNLYGNEDTYNAIPKIGTHVEPGILVANRRLDYSKALYDLQIEQLKKIDNLSDEMLFTGGGEVTDIEIYSNTGLITMVTGQQFDYSQLYKEYFENGKTAEEVGEIIKTFLKDKGDSGKLNIFTQEIINIYSDQLRYYTQLACALDKIITPEWCKPNHWAKYLMDIPNLLPKGKTTGTTKKDKLSAPIGTNLVTPKYSREENPNKYTDALAYLWKYAHEMINPEIKWRDNGNNFANIKIKLTVLKENPVSCGVKISGR